MELLPSEEREQSLWTSGGREEGGRGRVRRGLLALPLPLVALEVVVRLGEWGESRMSDGRVCGRLVG